MPEYKKVKDSGKRQEFDTGSRRDTREGKGRYDLISPVALARLAKHLENGAVKYGDRNWEKGQPVTRYFDSAVRHLYKYLEGHREEDHLSAAIWNIQAIIHTEEMILRGKLPKELNDFPNYLDDRSIEQQIEDALRKENNEKLVERAFGKKLSDEDVFGYFEDEDNNPLKEGD